MSLNTYLTNKKVTIQEGFTTEIAEQVKDLREILTTNNIIQVMEIGFNAGHSAELFLSQNPKIKLTSFDLGLHPYVNIGKEYIDKVYPGRHTLILGDSRNSIPNFHESNPKMKFDLIFIDGSHEYETVKADLWNSAKLSSQNTIVVLDDIIFKNHSNGWIAHFNVGPILAWLEAMTLGLIKIINHKDYQPSRGMCWGSYQQIHSKKQ